MATIFRAPVLSSYPARKTQQVDLVPNLLLSTLSLITAAVPLRPVPFDAPRPRLVSVQTELTPMPLLLRQAPAQKLPIGDNGYDEWAQPRLRPPQTQDTVPGTNLLTSVLPAGLGVGPFVPADGWQLGAIIRAQDTQSQNALLRLVSLGSAPFVPVDFAQRMRPLAAQDTQQPNVLVRISVPAQLLPVGTNGDDLTQVTRRATAPQDTQQSNVLIRISVPAQLLPVGTNGDDLTQVTRRGAVQDTQQPNVLIRISVPAQLLPVGTNADDLTPSTRRVAAVQADTPLNLLFNTLSASAQTAPVGTIGYDEWAQPRVSTPPQDTASPINLLTGTFGLTSGPFIPADTSQVATALRPQDTGSQNALLRLLPPGAITVPFGLNDWTQPVRLVVQQIDVWPNILLRTSTPAQILPIGTNGYDELAQPRLIYRPQDTSVPNSLIRITIPGQIAPPLVPVDWVQRKAPVPPQDTQVPNLLIRVLTPSALPFVAGADFAAQPRTVRVAQDTSTVATILYQTPSIAVPPFIPLDWTQRRGVSLPQDTGISRSALYQLLTSAPITPITFMQGARRAAVQIDVPGNLLIGPLGLTPPLLPTDLTFIPVKRPATQDTGLTNWILQRSGASFIPTLVGSPRYVVRHLRARRFTVSAVTYLQFEPIDPAEAVELTFDFAPDLPAGVTLTGQPTVTVILLSGTDATPSNLRNGAAGFDTTSTQVIVPVRGGPSAIDGNKYAVKVAQTTTDPELILALTGDLQIIEGA